MSEMIRVPATLPPFERVAFDDRFGGYMGLFIAMCLMFTALYYVWRWFMTSSSLCPQWLRDTFNNLSAAEQADWCSRMNSQFHSIVVCIAFPITLGTTTWNSDMIALDDGAINVRRIMIISVAYFTVDLCVILVFRVALWPVFVAHHIFASIPFFIHVFGVPECHLGTFELALFLLVEFATLFVNWQSWLETCNLAGTVQHTVSIYGTYLSWLATRVVMPVWIMQHLYSVYFVDSANPALHRWALSCLVPSFFCAHFITLFCWVVFFFWLTPPMWRRWFPGEDAPPAATAAAEGEAPLTSVRAAGGAAAPANVAMLAGDMQREVDQSSAAASIDSGAPAAIASTTNVPSPDHRARSGSGMAPRTTMSHEQLCALGHM